MGTLLVRGSLAVALLLTVIFPAWAQDPKGIGVVTALTGQADLKRPQAPQAPLKLRDNLFVRDVVDTHKESLARVLLLGRATITVRELSRFEIREETRPDGSQRALINLAEGKIRVMVARRLLKPGDEVEIRTPNALAGVRGSDGIIEVSKLPDGRPQTVITGVSGEFQLTLPTTPPFIANGREFQDGLALAGGAPRRDSPLLAMAETVSDAGPGVRVAQVPGLNVTALVQARITGAAGLQISTFVQLTLQQVLGIAGNYQLRVPPPPPPPAANDRAVNTGTALATTATLASGAQPGLTRGGGPIAGGGGGPPIVQTPVRTPVTDKKFSFTQVDPRISVLVYDCPSCANTINGYTGSGRLFRAVNVSSAEFQTMSASQISAYRVLAIPSTDALVTGVAGLLNNPNVGTAVTGNQVITGLHTEHNVGQKDQLVINAIQFAAQAGAGKTGLAAATDGCNAASCAGGKAGQTWINQNGSFLKTAFNGVTINRGLSVDAVTITNAASPVNSGSGLTGGKPLTDAGLSNWGNSVHSTFNSAPAGYSTIQTAGVGEAAKPVTLVK